MPRKRDAVTMYAVLEDFEADICAEMMRMLGITSQANLVRLGLWHLARHCDIPVGHQAFYERADRAPIGRVKNRNLAERVLSDEDIACEPRQQTLREPA